MRNRKDLGGKPPNPRPLRSAPRVALLRPRKSRGLVPSGLACGQHSPCAEGPGQRMPIDRHQATGWGVFGIKRHVKSGLQEGVRATIPCGLGLPARMLCSSTREKPPTARLTDGKAHGRESSRAALDPVARRVPVAHTPPPCVTLGVNVRRSAAGQKQDQDDNAQARHLIAPSASSRFQWRIASSGDKRPSASISGFLGLRGGRG